MTNEVDIRKAIQARSDQLNSDDLLAGPITGAITNVRAGNKEQPVQIDLDCWHVPYKPCKSMIRVLAACWGDNAKDWHGRSMTLYNDPEVVYGGIKAGGIRISHLSHIDKARKVPIRGSGGAGRKIAWPVEPLPDAAPATPEPTPEQIAATSDRAALRAMWNAASAETRALIEARVAELDATNGEQP